MNESHDSICSQLGAIYARHAMSVFVVVSSAPNPHLQARISSHFPGQYHGLSDSSWFVSAEMSAQRLSETLAPATGGPNVVVATLSGPYWGVATAATWEWLKSQFERASYGSR